MKHVAVVMAPRRSHRMKGDWACFVGSTQDEAVGAAMQARAEWGHARGYYILVGTLTHEAAEPVRYELRELPPHGDRASVLDEVIDAEEAF